MKNGFILLTVIFTASLSSGGYELKQSFITNGGGVISSKTLVLEGAAGQTAAGISQEKKFILNGGYWAGNHGCVVNMTDLAVLGEFWLNKNSSLNLQGEVVINMEDFAVLAANWLCECLMDWPLKQLN